MSEQLGIFDPDTLSQLDRRAARSRAAAEIGKVLESYDDDIARYRLAVASAHAESHHVVQGLAYGWSVAEGVAATLRTIRDGLTRKADQREATDD